MIKSNAQVQTQDAQRLINRLCRHWGHKYPVKLEEGFGEIELPRGMCRMYAGDVLTVELEGEGDQMPRFQEVVAEHLQRMAGKDEELAFEWR